jgi:hypothetical protein
VPRLIPPGVEVIRSLIELPALLQSTE